MGMTPAHLCLIREQILEADISKSGKHAMQLGTKDRADFTRAIETQESGICAGTTIMTLEGEMPVEHLSVGDRIITRDSGMAVLRDIQVTKTRTSAIRIKAGSLGHTRPDRDMIVSPQAQLHIRDWRAEALFGAKAAMVSADRLVDGEFLAIQDAQDITIYSLTFDRQHILYADGIELASAAV